MVKRPSRVKPIALVAGTLLFAALAIFHLRYSHAAAWRLGAHEQVHVERALAAAEADMRMSRDEIRRTTRPSLVPHPDRICVTLRTGTVWTDGSYDACHARRDGRLLTSRAHGPTFGARSLWHRAKDLFWALIW